jgi:Carboxypeptidase regulatory-like domain
MASSDKFAGQTLDGGPLLLVFLGLVLVMPISSVSIAQTTTSGGLAGVVTDPSNAVVPNAAVEIKDETKGTHQSTKTDREGVYRFFFLAPARYTLTVSLGGFREEKRAVSVLLGPPVSVNIMLEIAKASTSTTVTGEAPLIQAENGDVSATMNQKQISEVPNPGNDLTYIVQTAPGAVMNTEKQNGFNFSILGMPATSYLYTMDGMNISDNSFNGTLTGSLGLVLGQNQIQEATVVSTGYSGQFGGAAGGNINYITKSGSNEFHGNAQYYWNGRVLNANDWINNAFNNPRPFDIANQWAGSFGGPLKKSKLFFFFDTEGLRLLIPQILFGLIPSPQFEAATIANIDSRFGSTSASDAFYKRIFNLYNTASVKSSATPGGFTDPLGCTGFSDQRTGLGVNVPCALHFYTSQGRPSQDTLTSGRVDWNVSRSDRAFLRVVYDGGHSALYTDPISSVFDTDVTLRWWQGQIIETHTLGSSAANQFLLAGSYWTAIDQTKNPSQALAAFPTSLTFVPGTFTNLGGIDNVFGLGFGRSNTQYQLSDDFVKTLGTHKFGFGANFERIYWTFLGYTINAIGVLASQTLDAFYQGGVDPASPAVNFTELSQTFAAAKSQRIAFYNLGIYGQDEWHAQRNLTLTLALRVEHKSNPVCQSRCFARLSGPFESLAHDPNEPYNQAILINQGQALAGLDKILWSPRLSFAWQPLGLSRNTVIRGGFGIFYNPLQGYVTTRPSGNPPLLNSYTIGGDNLTPDEKTSLFKDAAASNAGFLDGFTAGKTLAQIQAADPNFFPPGIVVFQKRMHFPQYQKWSLEWQWALGTHTSVNIGYFGHHGIHELVENPSANAFGFGSLPAHLCTSPPVPPCADPRFSEVTVYISAAASNYNGIVVSFQHRFSRWSQGLFQANYTYGRAFDEVSNGGDASFTSGSSLNPQDPSNLRGAYGPAEYDIHHSFNANYVWEVPVKAALRGHGSDSLVKGWQVSGTIFVRTGFPYTVFDFTESGQLTAKNYFALLYAAPTGPLGSATSCGEGAAIPLAPHPCQPPQVLANGKPNPNSRFVQVGCETGFNTGNLPGPSGPCGGPAVAFAQGRNRFRGPSYLNSDFTIMKNTKIPGWENSVLGFGFQFFNLFNHPNFGFPVNDSSYQYFGQIPYLEQPPTSILGSGLGGDVAPRMIQLKAQLQF